MCRERGRSPAISSRGDCLNTTICPFCTPRNRPARRARTRSPSSRVGDILYPCTTTTIRQVRISSKLPPHKRSSTPPDIKSIVYQGINAFSFFHFARSDILFQAKKLHNFSQLYPDHDEHSCTQGNQQPYHPRHALLYPVRPDQS